MHKIARLALILGSALMFLSTTYASVPNHDHPTTFLGPNVKGKFTSPLTNDTAYSLAAEAGLKNFRVGGTIGWRIADDQRFKVSAEYLWQKITYAFFSGDSNQWVNQGAIGADYQYTFINVDYKPQLDLDAYYSHAPSKSLSTVSGTFISRTGLTQPFVNARRIAGSNAAGISPGVTIQPWMGGKVGADLNYDNVRYDKKYSPNEDAKGFGGTVRLSQVLFQNVVFSASAAVRQPFNNYTAGLAWSDIPYYGSWTLGLDGVYTAGKNTLPNTYDVSVSASYYMDPAPQCSRAQNEAAAKFVNYKGYKGYKDQAPPPADDFLNWTSDPGVYMPQVLAIVDQRVTTCEFGIPTFIGTIANVEETGGFGSPISIPTASHFTGHNLTFAISSITPALAAGDTLVINPNTGVITGSIFTENVYSVVVTASNPCGLASSNAFNVSSPG